MKTLNLLSQSTGIKFRDERLIMSAFVHRSHLNESKSFVSSNERLEFLGDSILSFIVSLEVYKKYPTLTEGELTNLRSSIVRTSTLSQVAYELNLGELLLLSKGEEEGGGRINSSLLADTFEAFLGAVYLDQGISSVKKILDKMLFPLLTSIIANKSYKDAKSVFQEVVQDEKRISPIYKVVKEEGPDHAKIFTVGAYVANVLWGIGCGKSKQVGEINAAKTALEKWLKK